MSGRHNAKHPLDDEEVVDVGGEVAPEPTDAASDGQVLTDFDQTNGIVDGLEGDDGGALDPELDRDDDLPLNRVVTDVIRGSEDERQTGETAYSEEGKI